MTSTERQYHFSTVAKSERVRILYVLVSEALQLIHTYG